MENPWKELPAAAPYILPADAEILERSGKINDFVFDVLPEPFLGSIENAKVVLLSLNPGFHDDDPPTHARADFSVALRKNLRQETSSYPFYLLNPQFSDAPGYAWWNKKLRALIKVCGRDLVSQNVACIEFFPYHSRKWSGMTKPIPSQEYVVHLVRQAIADKKLILLMRAQRQWFNCVSELKLYPRLLRLKNPRNISVSRNNILDERFDELAREIIGAKSNQIRNKY